MPEPISDAEALGKIAFEASEPPTVVDTITGKHAPATWDDLDETEWQDQGDPYWLPSKREYIAVAEKVRQAVCPPDHVVVPRAEHDALMAVIEEFLCTDMTCIADVLDVYEAIDVAEGAYRAALATEPAHA